MRVCVRACVRACVRGWVGGCVCAREGTAFSGLLLIYIIHGSKLWESFQ